MGFVKDTFLGGAEEKAGKQQEEAAREARDTTLQLFGETKEQLLPFITGGQEAFAQQQQQAGQKIDISPISSKAFQQQQALSGALGSNQQSQAFSNFRESPGQAFLREQGLAGVQGESAIGGGLGSGARLRELTRQSQGFAQQDFSNQFNRLGQVAGTELGIAEQQRQLELAEEANQFNRLGAVSGQGLSAAQALGGVSGTAAAGQSQALQAAGQAQQDASLASSGAKASSAIAAGAFLLSDKRLKKNIKKIGTKNGHSIYSWDWNFIANGMGRYGRSFGVIADEVKETNPEAIGRLMGFMTVNYKMIGVDNG